VTPNPSASVPLLLLVLVACASNPREPVAPNNSTSSIARHLPTRDLSRVSGNVVRHVIEGQVFYYVRSPCCDFQNYLFDSDGIFLCAPDGGFAGRGDGKCPVGLRINRSEGEVVPNPFYKP
jgi:hypothetical protein